METQHPLLPAPTCRRAPRSTTAPHGSTATLRPRVNNLPHVHPRPAWGSHATLEMSSPSLRSIDLVNVVPMASLPHRDLARALPSCSFPFGRNLEAGSRTSHLTQNCLKVGCSVLSTGDHRRMHQRWQVPYRFLPITLNLFCVVLSPFYRFYPYGRRADVSPFPTFIPAVLVLSFVHTRLNQTIVSTASHSSQHTKVWTSSPQ